MQKLDELIQFEQQVEKYHETLDLIHDTVACEIMKDPTKEQDVKQVFNPRIEHFRNKIRTVVSKNLTVLEENKYHVVIQSKIEL